MLPIDPESFPEGSPFRPIYKAVLEAFKTQSLIPRVGDGHIKADRAVLGRSQELRDMLSPALLAVGLNIKNDETCRPASWCG